MPTTLKPITMTVRHFIKNIPDNPIQRNTIRHATTYSRPGGHLESYHPTHLRVAIAETKDKKYRWKLDGHSRAYLWENQLLDIPDDVKLFVDVYTVKDKAEAMEYYLCFDADGSHETNFDKTSGALKFHGFNPVHPSMFKETGMMSAIKFMVFERKWNQAKHMTHVQLLKPWMRTLKQLDSIEKFYNAVRFPSVVMATAMMTTRRDGIEALEFWQMFHDGQGTRSRKSMNGVMKAEDVLQEFKNPLITKVKDYRKGRRYNEYTNKFLFCYDQWHDGKRFPLSVGTGKGARMWKGMMSPFDWWQTYLGDFDHPDIREQDMLPETD